MNDTQREEAEKRLEHIAWVKHCACALITRLGAPSRSGIFLSASARDHALACIREALDDLFRAEAAAARHIIEESERRDYRQAVRDWSPMS